MSSFHRLENYGCNHIEGEFIEPSFETKYRGIWQCRWTIKGMDEFASEPPFESLTKSEQREIKTVSRIVFYFTHGKVPNI
jgi:hypothetical protein